MRKFYLCLSIALMFTLNIFAQSQNNDNSVTAELTLKAAEGSNKTPVKVDNIWHGIKDSTVAEVELTITPRTLKNGSLEEEQCTGYTIKRYYGGSETTISNTSDIITVLAQEMNQQIVYEVVFHFQKRTRSTADSDWSDWEDMSDEVSTNNQTEAFNIYESPKMGTFLHKQNGNAYITQVLQDKQRQFTAPYSEDTGNPYGWEVSWELDGETVGSNSVYTFSSSQTGEKRLTCVITNKAPDKNHIWFNHTEPIDLTVYEKFDGNKLAEYIDTTNVTANSTYTNKGNCTYKVNIQNPENYGKGIYTWAREKDGNDMTISDNDGNLTDASFNPTKRGTYTTSLNVQYVNPLNSEEEWYNGTYYFDALQVYDNPTTITKENITKNFPEGAGANTYYGKTEDNTYTYSVSIPNGENYGKWIYNWSRNDTLIDNNNNSADITLTKNERATYTTKLTLKCVNPNDGNKEPEVWHEIKDIDFGKLEVYKNPNNLKETDFNFKYPKSEDKNLYAHTGQDNRGREYSVNLDDADAYGKWIYTWSREKDGEQLSSSHDNSFNIDNNVDKGVYVTTLSLCCVNPDDEKDIWYTPSVPTFEEYTVYDKPQDPQIKKYKDEKETTDNFVFKGTNYKIKFTDYKTTGNPEGWIFEWENDSENTMDTYQVNTQEATLSEKTPYITVKGRWKNVSPYYNAEKPDNDNEVWAQNETDKYHIYVCPKINDPVINQGENTPNLVYMAGDQLFFNIAEPTKLPSGWNWKYTWISNNDTLSKKNELPYTTTNNEDKVLNPTITCDIKGITSDNETCYHFWPNVTLNVYPKAKCEENYNHYKTNDTDNNYVMYIGDTFDASKLFTVSGGFTEGWRKVLTVDRDSIDGLNFTPDRAGDYDLHLSVKNIATLTDGNEATWFGKEGNNFEKDYKITVLDNRPSFDYIVSTQADNKDEVSITNESGLTEDVESLKSIDIENNEEITIKITLNGGVIASGDGEKVIDNWTVEHGGNTLEEGKDYTVSLDGDIYTFTMKGVNNTISNTISDDYTLSYTIKNNPNHIINGSEYKKTFKKKISVWKKFDAELAIDNFSQYKRDDDNYYVIETCDGLNTNNVETITLKSIGGSANKWTMTCTEEGNDNGTTLTQNGGTYGRNFTAQFKVNPDENTSKEEKYTINAHYQDGNKTKDIPIKIAVISWPKPQIKDITVRLKDKPETHTSGITYPINQSTTGGVNINNVAPVCFNKDVIQICFTPEGGKPSDGENTPWVENFGLSNNIDFSQYTSLGNDGIKDITATYNDNNSTLIGETYSWKVSYQYTGGFYTSKRLWYEGDIYNINIKSYQLPTLKPALQDSLSDFAWEEVRTGKSPEKRIHVYAGGETRNNVNLNYTHSKGFSDGWSYEWFIDDVSQNKNISSWTYVPTLNDAKNSFEDKTIKVHIVDSLPDGNKGLDTTYVYPITVWRKAEFADDFTLEDETQGRDMTNGVLKIREGNKISGTVNKTQYGYNPNDNEDFYSYVWKGNNVNTSTKTWGNNVNKLSSDTKASERHTYELMLESKSPYGKAWAYKHITQEIEIYNKPETPKSIVQKGSGASGTMIITADVTENDLNGRDYYLVFGYTDANGTDHDFASQQQKGIGQVRWSSQFKNEIPNETQRKYAMEHAYAYAVWKYSDGVEITSGKCKRVGNGSEIDEDYDSSTYNGMTRAAIAGGDADAIEMAKGTAEEVRSVYTLNGIRIGSTLSGLKPGLYIVEYADGVTNKISVK